jgi:uncharacterized iron-regulated protein
MSSNRSAPALLPLGLLLALAAPFSGCQAPARPLPAEAGGDPPLARLVRVFDARAAREIDLDAMLDVLARADAVFLGEGHLDDVTHRVELAVYEGLLARRAGRVVLAMEMFGVDAQPALDDYTAGRIEEAELLRRAQVWGNYAGDYRPLVERARRERLPVVGSNAPAQLARKVSSGGAAAFAALTAEEKAMLPPALLHNSDAYWERFRRTVRGHMNLGGGGDRESLLYSTQSLWDNTMGWSCARALERWPGHAVVHVNGGFHSSHAQGTVEQLAQRRPGARIATVQIVATDDLPGADAPDDPAAADFVVFAASRARSEFEGLHAVTSPRELRYRLHLPPRPRTGDLLPLLIWLPVEGSTSAESLEGWRAALRDEAAIAVLEPPFPQVEEDLGRGGRWYWNEGFQADAGAAVGDVERVRRAVLGRFPVDAARVVVGGEGTGGTLAAAAALWDDVAAARVVAVAPRQFRRLKERPLPERALAHGRLTLLLADAARAWWETECKEHATRGLDARLDPLPADGTGEAAVRAGLGLAALPTPASSLGVAVPAGASARARRWALLYARASTARGTPARVVQPGDSEAPGRVLAFPGELDPAEEARLAAAGARLLAPSDVAGQAVPPAPGSFGGTTVLVVPATCPPATRAAWREWAQGNPMGAHGRFFRLELAFEDEAPRLPDVLQGMAAQGRRNALVVPAVYCAGPEAMRRLRDQVGSLEESLTLSWLPGLGSRLHRG